MMKMCYIKKFDSENVYTSCCINWNFGAVTALNLSQPLASNEAVPLCMHRCNGVGFKNMNGSKKPKTNFRVTMCIFKEDGA